MVALEEVLHAHLLTLDSLSRLALQLLTFRPGYFLHALKRRVASGTSIDFPKAFALFVQPQLHLSWLLLAALVEKRIDCFNMGWLRLAKA